MDRYLLNVYPYLKDSDEHSADVGRYSGDVDRYRGRNGNNLGNVSPHPGDVDRHRSNVGRDLGNLGLFQYKSFNNLCHSIIFIGRHNIIGVMTKVVAYIINPNAQTGVLNHG
jgi:hypothetical protein